MKKKYIYISRSIDIIKYGTNLIKTDTYNFCAKLYVIQFNFIISQSSRHAVLKSYMDLNKCSSDIVIIVFILYSLSSIYVSVYIYETLKYLKRNVRK